MKFEYLVEEVSDTNWQEILDSDNDDLHYQHLNKFGEQGWELINVIPTLENGTTKSYALVFKRPISD